MHHHHQIGPLHIRATTHHSLLSLPFHAVPDSQLSFSPSFTVVITTAFKIIWAVLPGYFSAMRTIPTHLPASRLLSSVLLFQPVRHDQTCALNHCSAVKVIDIERPALCCISNGKWQPNYSWFVFVGDAKDGRFTEVICWQSTVLKPVNIVAVPATFFVGHIRSAIWLNQVFCRDVLAINVPHCHCIHTIGTNRLIYISPTIPGFLGFFQRVNMSAIDIRTVTIAVMAME
ncbi:hypothetical protein AD44_3908 [Escherichia coli 3-373-03_S4_C3]|nr:hypothetical protein AD17_4144 [Escherichia coli 3-373-03_S4_C2]KDU50586.1 hypothetical protein AC89_3982 [Escherichia coli 3-373-03_S4_C1]KEL22523.1 hypothetical protein AD44_3908 [Escherichia coli 3-373-03_S4_C3]